MSLMPHSAQAWVEKKEEGKLSSSSHSTGMVPGGEGGLVRDEFWGVGGAIADRG